MPDLGHRHLILGRGRLIWIILFTKRHSSLVPTAAGQLGSEPKNGPLSVQQTNINRCNQRRRTPNAAHHQEAAAKARDQIQDITNDIGHQAIVEGANEYEKRVRRAIGSLRDPNDGSHATVTIIFARNGKGSISVKGTKWVEDEFDRRMKAAGF